MDVFFIHLIHQPKRNKISENLHRMLTVRCRTERQINMAKVREIRLLIKFFQTILVNKLSGFFQFGVVSAWVWQFLNAFHEQFQIGSYFFLWVRFIQVRLKGIKDSLSLLRIMKLLFQPYQSIRICLAQLHTVTVAIRVIFLIKVQKFNSQVMIGLRLLFFIWQLRQFRFHHRNFYISCKRSDCTRQIEHRVCAISVCLHIVQSDFAALIMPVILGCSFPQRQHHLIDFFHAGRIDKLLGNLLNTFPIICNSIELIRPWIQLRGIHKESVDTSGKLFDFIACHRLTVFF